MEINSLASTSCPQEYSAESDIIQIITVMSHLSLNSNLLSTLPHPMHEDINKYSLPTQCNQPSCTFAGVENLKEVHFDQLSNNSKETTTNFTLTQPSNDLHPLPLLALELSDSNEIFRKTVYH